MKKYIFILIVFSLLACWPFFKKGYFESHDGEWMVIRFTAFHQALASGQFPVRFVDRLNNNYGYPVLNFLYPLPFYLAEIPKALGFGFVDSVKIVFVLSTVSSVIAMFWALKQIFGLTPSFAGAIIYLFIPYRFVDLYVRGSIGENVAFVFVPLIAGSVVKITKGNKLFSPLLALCIAALILSHNVIAVLLLPFLGLWAFFLLDKKITPLIAPTVFGVLMAAFFWLPAFYDLKYVQLSQIKVSEISNYLVDITKLILPTWGYGPNPNSIGGLSVQIGLVALFVIASAILVMLKTKKETKVITYFLTALLLIVFVNTKQAQFIWQVAPGADIIQFPFRLHSITILIVAFLTAYTLENSRKKMWLITLVIFSSVTSTIVYTKPATFVDKGDGFYSTNEDTTNVRDEYLPLWVNVKPEKRPSEKIEILGSGKIISKTISPVKYQATIEAAENTKVQVNTIYFPGWKVKSNGAKINIDYLNPKGLITFDLPRGMHEVIISYGRSPVHLASELISMFAILATGGYFFLSWRKQNS